MIGIFDCVLKMSVDASYMIVAVILVRFLLCKSSKIFMKVLWILVGLRLAVPFSFESVWSLIPEEIPVVSNGGGVTSELNTTVACDTANTGIDLSGVIPFVWVGVTIILALVGLVSFIRLKEKISDAVILSGRVYQSEKVESPFVCGFFNPKIYIPYKMKEDTLECVLKHEYTHIKCFDHILKIIGFTILCVHWFNPLVWLSYVLFCKDTELLCDELVVKNMSEESRKKYVSALCEIGIGKMKVSVCPVAFGELGIKERVKYAINYKKAKRLVLIISLAVCVAIAVCFMTTPVEAVAEKDVKDSVQIEEFTNPSEPTTVVEEVTETTVNVTQPITESVAQPNDVQVEITGDDDYYYDDELISAGISEVYETEVESEINIETENRIEPESEPESEPETEPLTELETETIAETSNSMFNLAASAAQENVYDWSNQEKYSFDMELVEDENSTPSDDMVWNSAVADSHDIG